MAASTTAIGSGDVLDPDTAALLESIKACCDPLHRRLQVVERENDDLKRELVAMRTATGGIVFRGPWRDGETYSHGEVVQRQGAIWICAAARAGPSDIPMFRDSVSDDGDTVCGPWRLACRPGKPGKSPGADLELRVRALEKAVRS
jgi:hypothetical protein